MSPNAERRRNREQLIAAGLLGGSPDDLPSLARLRSAVHETAIASLAAAQIPSADDRPLPRELPHRGRSGSVEPRTAVYPAVLGSYERVG
jgi:hypothetical protein